MKQLVPVLGLSAWLGTLLATGHVLDRHGLGGVQYRQAPITTTTSATRTQFTVPASADSGAELLPNVDDLEAVDPQTVCPGYLASNVQNTTHGFTANLDLAGSACNVYGNDVAALTLIVEYQAKDRFHLEILPRYLGAENTSWYVLPEEIIPRPAVEEDEASADGSDSDFVFEWSNEPSFGFAVSRKSNGDVLFDTRGRRLVFEDQFFEFTSPLPENYNLYGLGEVIHGFRLNNNLTRTIYAADVGDPIDGNIYGSHPIYLDTRYFTPNETTGSETYVANATDLDTEYVSYTHGVFLRNAHGLEVLLRPGNITWRGIGGTIDLYFYAGPTVETALKTYQLSTVGLPAMQQYWTFGFHQCRWGYTGWDNLQEVIDDFAKFEIPLETVWADIDYMNQYRDFENDQLNWSYAAAGPFFERLHANGQHFVPIIDAAIYVPNPENASDGYATYDRGIEADAFMLNPDGSLYIGAVWPGYTVFPDWLGAVFNGSRTFEWWAEELAIWYQHVPFSGAWIDMNEVSSFCVGSCGSGNLTLNPVHPPFALPGEPGNEVLAYPEGFNLTNATEAASISSYSSSLKATETADAAPTSSTSTSYLRTTPTPGARNINYPPYVLDHIQGDLAVHATSPNATHHSGTQEYDFHNIWGHQILNATYNALLSSALFPGKRPFILGRSTFAGSGKWTAHWGGDNSALWAYMEFSIPQALSFSIFGIPMFGVDTCGFGGNTDLELCSRWMQLSAFFPFYRNHNILAAIPQEPYRWEAVATASKAAMHVRYSLLPYIYTVFHSAHSKGDTVMRALAWEFPNEPWLAGADRQFLLGPAVLVTPCLVQRADTVDGVFPGVGAKGDETAWYDWYTHAPVEGVGRGENVTIAAPLGHIPVYLRGGYVVPTQEPALTTRDSRRNPWGVIVALDGKGKAEGELYLDDGESLEPNATTTVKFFASSGCLTACSQGNYTDTNALRQVTVLGVSCAPKQVSLNGNALESGAWAWNRTSRALSVTGSLLEATAHGAWASSWTLTWE